jgi:hypothetical protein
MAEIYVNSTAPIKHKVFYRGEIANADSNPTVKVYDVTDDPALIPELTPDKLIITLDTEPTEIDTGVYQVFLPYVETAYPRSLKFLWEYEVNGEPMSKLHPIFVVPPYTDITQAMDVLNIGVDPHDPNYKTYFELSEAEKYARKQIENFTLQKFYLQDQLFTVWGSGADSLPLPFRLVELHELYMNDILLIDTVNNINNFNYSVQVSESQFGIRINRANMLDNTVYVANGMVPPTINDQTGGAFRMGVPYRIQGKFGWGVVPDEVELACIELMKDYFNKDSWRNKYIKSISTFDWQFEYNSTSLNGTGNLYVDQLLAPYVLSQMQVI